MNITTLVVGQLQANCYIVACSTNKRAIVIDPGAEYMKIASTIQERGYTLEYILNTHGHMDHVGANQQLRTVEGGKLGIHQNDVSMLDVRFSMQNIRDGEEDRTEGYPDFFLNDGDRIQCGQMTIEVLHTPGHTPGGVCFRIDNHLFTGDTLFAGSVGRWDFTGGSYEELMNSIKSKLAILPDETIIYPGHGPKSTMGFEKKHNPFMNG